VKILSDEVALALFASYRDALEAADIALGPALYPDFIGRSHDVRLGEFPQMARQHQLDLTNFVNEFRVYLLQLASWEKVLASTPDEQKVQAVFEFVLPLGYYLVSVPYALKNRLTVSVAHLSHQANRYSQAEWRDNVDLRRPGFKQASALASGWPAWPALRENLARLNDSGFTEAVGDFRNLYHHGLPRNLETGQTSYTRRVQRGDGSVMYVLGVEEPLAISALLGGLIPQYQAGLASLEAYHALVREQYAGIQPTAHAVRYEVRRTAAADAQRR